MRRRLATLVVVALACFSMAPRDGCLPPQRIDVSSDGKTLYFSLSDGAGFQSKASSNMYALDVEKGRLKALTDAPYEEGWCTLTDDGEALLHMLYAGEMCVQSLELEDGKSRPLSGVAEPHGYPTVIPSREGTSCLLMLRTRALDPEDPPSWALYTGDKLRPVPLAIPKGFTSIGHWTATAVNRFAVFMARRIEDEQDKAAKERWEMVVFVVDIVSKEVRKKDGEGTEQVHDTRVTQAARWEFGEDDASGKAWHLAFTPDGKRLLALMPVENDGKTNTHFLEIDPTRKTVPKLLFKDQDAFRPQWTPDGKAVVYMRMRPENAGWREMVLRPLDAKEPVVLARLPGGVLGADTCLRWNEKHILSAYHLSDDGVRIVRIHPDLKTTEVKHLSREKLKVQRHLADLERALDRIGDLPEEEEEYEVVRPNPRAATEDEKAFEEARKTQIRQVKSAPETLRPLYRAVERTNAEVRAAIEAEWDKVDDYEKVPPLPDRLDEALEDKAAELERARASLKEPPETDDPAERAEAKRRTEDRIRHAEEELKWLQEIKRLRAKP